MIWLCTKVILVPNYDYNSVSYFINFSLLSSQSIFLYKLYFSFLYNKVFLELLNLRFVAEYDLSLRRLTKRSLKVPMKKWTVLVNSKLVLIHQLPVEYNKPGWKELKDINKGLFSKTLVNHRTELIVVGIGFEKVCQQAVEFTLRRPEFFHEI